MALQEILISMFYALESNDLNTYANLRQKALEIMATQNELSKNKNKKKVLH